MTTDEMIRAMFEEGVRHGIWEGVPGCKEAWRLTELGRRLSQMKPRHFYQCQQQERGNEQIRYDLRGDQGAWSLVK
jgi:hypothetical protein